MWMALGVVTIRATPQKALQSLFNGVSMHFFSKVFFWGHADRFLLLFSKSQLFQIHLGIVHTKQSCTSALSSTILLSAYKVPRAILLGNLTKPEINPKPRRTNSPFGFLTFERIQSTLSLEFKRTKGGGGICDFIIWGTIYKCDGHARGRSGGRVKKYRNFVCVLCA